MDLSNTIIPKSDQLNAEDLLTGPRTFTVGEVVVKSSSEQPVDIHLAELPGRPFRPSKTVLRILVTAWGKESDAYVGRRMTLYRDEKVKWAGQEVGGIRVSHLSHITKPMKLALTETRGKKENHTVQPLPDAPATPDYVALAKAATDIDGWRKVWQQAKDAGHLTDALKAKLTPIGEALKTPAKAPDVPVDEPPADAWPDVAQIPGVDQ